MYRTFSFYYVLFIYIIYETPCKLAARCNIDAIPIRIIHLHIALHFRFDYVMLYAAKILSDEEEEEYQNNGNQKVEAASVTKDLSKRLNDLQACNDLISKQGTALQRALTDLETLETPSPELAAKFKIVSERATLFRIAANAMISVRIINGFLKLSLKKAAASARGDTFRFCYICHARYYERGLRQTFFKLISSFILCRVTY